MAQTGAIFNSLIFGNVDSANYGIYITGEAVYNAPERAVESINIPGRNGALLLDHGYWENIEITYPAGTFADNAADFADAICAFRNAIASQIGYQRLTDAYNPNEYRMAVYASGLEVDVVSQCKAGEFEITFNAKPQRWLLTGENKVTVANNDTVFNPTKYDASPLLEVTGYGNIGFNGYNIEVKNETYGNVELLPSSGGVNTYQLDTSVFNSGDTIYIGETVFQWFFIPRNYPTKYWTSYSISDFGLGTTSTVSEQTGNKVVCKTVFPADSFASNANYAESTICTVSVNMNDGTTKSFQIVCSIFYDYTDGTIFFGIADTGASDFFLYEDAKSGAVTVNSTKSIVSGTIYIDCDLGEAYSLNNGVATGLNAYVDIGSDLPKMAPGSNTVTFDNTVTDLKITPRWWQL